MRGRVMRAAWLVVVLAASGIAPAAAAPAGDPPITLATLLRELARAPGLEARFRERKQLALLTRPLESTGTLYYAPPGRFARRTTTPTPSLLIVTPTEIRSQQGDEAHTIEVAMHPSLAALVQGFVTVLRGDEAALRAAFEVEFETMAGSVASWQLALRPHAGGVGALVQRIVVRGAGIGFTEVRVVEADGDEAVMTFTDVDLHRRFTPEELNAVFGPSP